MGNTFGLTNEATPKKQIVLQHDHSPTHELESGHMLLAPLINPTAESIVVNKQVSRRIKLVITKQQLQQLVSKHLSIQDIINAQTADNCSHEGPLTSIFWKPKLGVRPDLEDPPHVPPDDGKTMLARQSALEVYGRPIVEGVLVHANLSEWWGAGMISMLYQGDRVMDVLSSLMDSDDESVTMASKPKPVIPLGNGADGSSGVTTGGSEDNRC
nr:hypothetical protein [Tanacetum cinerariifolium]